MNRGSATGPNRLPYDPKLRPYDPERFHFGPQLRLYDTPSKGFKAKLDKYPVTSCMLILTILVSLITLVIVISDVAKEFDDPTFKIEIETNSTWETALNQTALNQTELYRKFNKIYTYLTSAESDEVLPPSYKMNVIKVKTDTGVALAVCFFVFIVLFIVGLGLYGIDLEEPKLIMPFHICWYIFTFMTGLSLPVMMSIAARKRKKNLALCNSPGVSKEEEDLFLGFFVGFCLVVLACYGFIFTGAKIRSELKYMRTGQKHKTRRSLPLSI